MRHALRFGSLAVLLVTLSACGSAPYTGRSQLHILSVNEEMALGLQSYTEVVGSSKLTSNREWAAMVERVGRRIAAVAPEIADIANQFQWEFKVIADPQVNAFALPGGKVAFYEGIMPICANETGVAVVMGHEVAHAIARHGNERVSQNVLIELGVGTGSALLGGSDPATQQAVSAALGMGAQVGIALPFGRSHESEADHIGIILMAKAGYDPREAPGFWERMSAQSSGGGTPEFLSTHPSHGTRIDQLKEWMPEAMKFYKP